MKKIIVILSILSYLTALDALAANMPAYSSMYIYDNQDCYTDTDIIEQPIISDPFYIINKQIFSFNGMMDTVIVIPAMEIYTTVIPKRGRVHVSNVLNNLAEPINLFNQIFQGNFAQARITFGRFITNTLLGCLGIMDVATSFNLKYHGEDFGQTLAHYNLPMGPYIVLPILGPSSLRDTSGKIVDYFIDPFEHVFDQKTRDIINITWAMQKRVDANGVIKTVKASIDPYETAKQIYVQNRIKQIKGN